MRLFSSLFSFLLILTFSLSSYGLSMAPPPPGLDQNMAAAGKQGLILSGKIVSAEPITLPNGWQGTQCKFEGQVIKGNDQYAASEQIQTIEFKTAAAMVRGLVNCQAGMEGIFTLYGQSKPFGLTSFVFNGGGNILMEKGSDGKFYSTRKTFQFQNKGLREKFSQSNPALARKALTTTNSVSVKEAGLSMTEATDLARYVAKNLFPEQTQ